MLARDCHCDLKAHEDASGQDMAQAREEWEKRRIFPWADFVG